MLLIFGFAVTDEPSRRADCPARNRTAFPNRPRLVPPSRKARRRNAAYRRLRIGSDLITIPAREDRDGNSPCCRTDRQSLNYTHPPPCGPRHHAECVVFADFRKRTPPVAPEWRSNAVTETVPSFRRFPDQLPTHRPGWSQGLMAFKGKPAVKSRMPSS
jgi:hypothetical protein